MVLNPELFKVLPEVGIRSHWHLPEVGIRYHWHLPGQLLVTTKRPLQKVLKIKSIVILLTTL